LEDVMSEQRDYDLIVIGSGGAAFAGAIRARDLGRRVLMVDRGTIGGTCVNVGCTPTKTMIASARVAYLARRAADYGVVAGPVRVDLAKVRRRKQAIVESFRSSGQSKLEKTPNVTLLFGEARFTGPKAVEVALNDGGTRRLTADKVFINTGARPAVPALPGLDQVPALDSTSVMELDEIPGHLLVLGGGRVILDDAHHHDESSAEQHYHDEDH
jgi:pyruvate/2-oxoglutarate dehydrogenase complex dihydrolipoamide dehydrogenase (E3) component